MLLVVYSYYPLCFDFKTYSEAASAYETVVDVCCYQSEFLCNSHQAVLSIFTPTTYLFTKKNTTYFQHG